MEEPPQKRQKRNSSKKRGRWTADEDIILKHYKTLFPNLGWEAIIQIGNLSRDIKSVSHRWENYLKEDFNRAEFSEEEDNILICVMSLSPDRPWKFISKFLLPGRAKNDLKNYWNNHLQKKGQATTSDPDRQAELEAWFAEALI